MIVPLVLMTIWLTFFVVAFGGPKPTENSGNVNARIRRDLLDIAYKRRSK